MDGGIYADYVNVGALGDVDDVGAGRAAYRHIAGRRRHVDHVVTAAREVHGLVLAGGQVEGVRPPEGEDVLIRAAAVGDHAVTRRDVELVVVSSAAVERAADTVAGVDHLIVARPLADRAGDRGHHVQHVVVPAAARRGDELAADVGDVVVSAAHGESVGPALQAVVLIVPGSADRTEVLADPVQDVALAPASVAGGGDDSAVERRDLVVAAALDQRADVGGEECEALINARTAMQGAEVPLHGDDIAVPAARPYVGGGVVGVDREIGVVAALHNRAKVGERLDGVKVDGVDSGLQVKHPRSVAVGRQHLGHGVARRGRGLDRDQSVCPRIKEGDYAGGVGGRETRDS
jgi:hypothetical protein